MSNSSSLLGKDVLQLFPSLDRLDFSRNCEAYGRWLGSVFAPDPWMPNATAMGTISLSIDLLSYALPDNFTNTTEGAWIKESTLPIVFGKMADWWAVQLFGTEVVVDGVTFLAPSEALVKRAGVDPIEKCPKEYCKAYAFKGNGDTAGIGVCCSLLLFFPSAD